MQALLNRIISLTQISGYKIKLNFNTRNIKPHKACISRVSKSRRRISPNDLVLATAPSTDPVLEEVGNDKLVSPFTFPVGNKQSPFNKDGSAKPPFEEAVLARVDFVPTVKELRASKVYCDELF
jgi:hypothetical protein